MSQFILATGAKAIIGAVDVVRTRREGKKQIEDVEKQYAKRKARGPVVRPGQESTEMPLDTTEGRKILVNQTYAKIGAMLGAKQGKIVGQLTNEFRAWLADKTIIGDPNAKTIAGLTRFTVVSPKGGLNKKALIAGLDSRWHKDLPLDVSVSV
jgi:hypothetical protein